MAVLDLSGSNEWKTYKERWFVLFVALFCNVSAGLVKLMKKIESKIG